MTTYNGHRNWATYNWVEYCRDSFTDSDTMQYLIEDFRDENDGEWDLSGLAEHLEMDFYDRIYDDGYSANSVIGSFASYAIEDIDWRECADGVAAIGDEENPFVAPEKEVENEQEVE